MVTSHETLYSLIAFGIEGIDFDVDYTGLPNSLLLEKQETILANTWEYNGVRILSVCGCYFPDGGPGNRGYLAIRLDNQYYIKVEFFYVEDRETLEFASIRETSTSSSVKVNDRTNRKITRFNTCFKYNGAFEFFKDTLNMSGENGGILFCLLKYYILFVNHKTEVVPNTALELERAGIDFPLNPHLIDLHEDISTDSYSSYNSSYKTEYNTSYLIENAKKEIHFLGKDSHIKIAKLKQDSDFKDLIVNGGWSLDGIEQYI